MIHPKSPLQPYHKKLQHFDWDGQSRLQRCDKLETGQMLEKSESFKRWAGAYLKEFCVFGKPLRVDVAWHNSQPTLGSWHCFKRCSVRHQPLASVIFFFESTQKKLDCTVEFCRAQDTQAAWQSEKSAAHCHESTFIFGTSSKLYSKLVEDPARFDASLKAVTSGSAALQMKHKLQNRSFLSFIVSIDAVHANKHEIKCNESQKQLNLRLPDCCIWRGFSLIYEITEVMTIAHIEDPGALIALKLISCQQYQSTCNE